MKYRLLYLFLLLFSFLNVKAQVLTLDDCVRQAIESNYGIKIAKNSESISRVNLKSYNVFLPAIYGEASHGNTYTSGTNYALMETKWFLTMQVR